MSEGYFDIQRDLTYPYFIQACLVGKTESEMSNNKRFCIECQSFITSEYALTYPESHSNGDTDCNKTSSRENHTDETLKVLVLTKRNLGGRPKRDVPVELIRKLSNQGKSVRDITKELKAQGQTISTMTVSRILSGKRN